MSDWIGSARSRCRLRFRLGIGTPLARIIILEDMRRAVIPASAKSLTQLQPKAWIRLNITHVPCFDAVFRHDPELIADAPIAHRGAPELACLATDSFGQRVPWPPKADGEEKLNRRIEEIFLQKHNFVTNRPTLEGTAGEHRPEKIRSIAFGPIIFISHRSLAENR